MSPSCDRRAPQPLPKDGVFQDLPKASPEGRYLSFNKLRSVSLSLTMITLGHNVLCTAPATPHSEANVLKSIEGTERLFHLVTLL